MLIIAQNDVVRRNSYSPPEFLRENTVAQSSKVLSPDDLRMDDLPTLNSFPVWFHVIYKSFARRASGLYVCSSTISCTVKVLSS
jgi:hypothetical protein